MMLRNAKINLLTMSLVLTAIACVCSSNDNLQSITPTSEVVTNLDSESITSARPILQEEKDWALERITDELQQNQTEIVLKPEDFLFTANPIGEGFFVHEPETRFFGIERYFIWVVVDEYIALINGATKNVTPNLPYLREIPFEVASKTNLSTSSAIGVIDFLFSGEKVEPYSRTTPANTNTPELADKFGYSLAERMQIFYEIGEVEDRAQAEADLRYPTPDPFSDNYSNELFVEALNNNIDYFDTQREIYRQEVANKYGLTLEELNEIAHEGILNDWPLPP